MAIASGRKVLSVALTCALVLGGSSAIVGVQAAAPQAMGNVAYAKTYKGDDGEITYKKSPGKGVRAYKCIAKTRSTVEIAGTVSYLDKSGKVVKTYPVKGITSKAFKGCKATTVVIYTTKLTKKNVKNCFKKSKVEVVEVPKKVLKKYRKYFTKKNCGRDVEVVKNYDYSKTVEKLPVLLG